MSCMSKEGLLSHRRTQASYVKRPTPPISHPAGNGSVLLLVNNPCYHVTDSPSELGIRRQDLGKIFNWSPINQ